MIVMASGMDRPSRDTGGISAFLVLFCLGGIDIAVLTDPPVPWPGQLGRPIVATMLTLAVVASVGAAIVSFLTWLEWGVGRRTRPPDWVHVGASSAVGLLAIAILGLTVDWLNGPVSELQLAAAFAWPGAIALVVQAFDVERARRTVEGRPRV
jgi:hypothetical protein